MATKKTGNTEQREFKLHKDILWSIIQSQAGTLGKAILELVMNSIDAGASKVDIQITDSMIVVSDDGKGFTSRAEIESFFETFGTPHTEGDATYGRFRMGRGQIMAFSRNIWQSGEFEMDVNIRDDGLNYKLSQLTKAVSGCTIKAELYDKLKPSEMVQLIDSVAQLCHYTPVPVSVNKKRVSLDMDKQKWSHQDDNAYYLYRKGRDLEVYNLGVLVRSYSGSQMGVGGVVVSKKQLDVNFARNDILVSKCKVWKEISATVKAYAAQDNGKKPVQDEEWRCNMMSRFISAEFDGLFEYMEALDKHKVFSDVSGKHYTIASLKDAAVEHCSAIVADGYYPNNTMADKVQQHKLALVLSQVSSNRHSMFTLADVFDRIIDNLKMFEGRRDADWVVKARIKELESLKDMIKTLDMVKERINEACTMVDSKKLNKEERCVLKAIEHMSHLLARSMQVETRQIRICESEAVEGFTDGESYIAVERKYLKINGNSHMDSFGKIKYLLVHEYCHDTDDSSGHGHTAEFYEKFHNFLMSYDNQYSSNESLAYYGLTAWLGARKNAGLKMSHNTLKLIDRLSVESEDEQEVQLKAA